MWLHQRCTELSTDESNTQYASNSAAIAPGADSRINSLPFLRIGLMRTSYAGGTSKRLRLIGCGIQKYKLA
ncbi:MAG: hypothetical protein AB1861_00200 [Cyanobacteriota bacterium]